VKYRYQVVSVQGLSSTGVAAFLNGRGAEGYRVVFVTDHHVYLERIEHDEEELTADDDEGV
jgi:hypothetical protein